MNQTLATLRGWSLSEKGPTLDLALHPSEWYAVLGRTGSGKSGLLAAFSGKAAARGHAAVQAPIAEAALPTRRRATPNTWSRTLAGMNAPGPVSAALTALGLWDARLSPFQQLPEGLRHAASLLPCLLAPPGSLLLVDGQLDHLDPWTLPGAMDALATQVHGGCAALVATNRPDIAERIGSLIVLSEGSPRFVGSTKDLMRRSRPSDIEVHTDDGSTVASVAAPLAISVRREPHGITLTAEKGMETAAQLLVQGYGRMKAVVVKEPTIQEMLADLI